jgi:7-cyano-7-deazaguanine synthase
MDFRGKSNIHMTNKEKNAIVLLSGGMDSATCLAIATAEGYGCHTLAFDYGQRHRIELTMAERQARAFHSRQHLVVRVELDRFGGSALTSEQAVPKTEADLAGRVPVTYVPARNTVFLSLGLAWAEALGAHHLFIGANQVDFSGYPDCRRAFLEAFEAMANLATRMGTEGRPIHVQAPLLDLTKAQIIARGLTLGVNYADTHTCYDPDPRGRSCGRCPSCRLRLKGFADVGVTDPLPYLAP